MTGSTKALPFQLLLPYRLINHKLCFRNLSFSEKNPTKQINKLTWVSFSPQVINMSKVVPPKGPPGHNGTQGPVGSPGPSGPRGSPGPGANLSLCYYQRKQNRSLTSDKKTESYSICYRAKGRLSSSLLASYAACHTIVPPVMIGWRPNLKLLYQSYLQWQQLKSIVTLPAHAEILHLFVSKYP